MKDTYVFPAFFCCDEDGVSVEFPDLPGCLPCAPDQETAFQNAREALGLHLFGMEQDGETIPEPTPVSQLRPEQGQITVLIDVYMPAVCCRVKKATMKKTLSVPVWLNMQAERAGINFSQVLQEGLKQRLGVQ